MTCIKAVVVRCWHKNAELTKNLDPAPLVNKGARCQQRGLCTWTPSLHVDVLTVAVKRRLVWTTLPLGLRALSCCADMLGTNFDQQHVLWSFTCWRRALIVEDCKTLGWKLGSCARRRLGPVYNITGLQKHGFLWGLLVEETFMPALILDCVCYSRVPLAVTNARGVQIGGQISRAVFIWISTCCKKAVVWEQSPD